MANIFDVARKAGVSKSTVSRVFSGSRHVSPENRAKIINAADEMGYVPSGIARQMRSQKTKKLGFLARTYYPAVGDLINYITHYAEDKGYSVIVYFSKDKEQELQALNNMKLKLIDGLFLIEKINSWKDIELFTRYGPIATWRRIDSDVIYSSYIDHYPLYNSILEYVNNTYDVKKIGHILNSTQKGNTKARQRAIMEFSKLHPNIDNHWQVFYMDQEKAGKKAAESFIKLQSRPEVVLAYSDYVASEFMATLFEEGINVPNDVKVFGFDNSDYGKYMNISTVDTCLEHQAENCVNNVISKLEHTEFAEISIEPKMILRKTC